MKSTTKAEATEKKLKALQRRAEAAAKRQAVKAEAEARVAKVVKAPVVTRKKADRAQLEERNAFLEKRVLHLAAELDEARAVISEYEKMGEMADQLKGLNLDPLKDMASLLKMDEYVCSKCESVSQAWTPRDKARLLKDVLPFLYPKTKTVDKTMRKSGGQGITVLVMNQGERKWEPDTIDLLEDETED